MSSTPSPAVRWLGLAGLAAPVGFTVSAVTHSLVWAEHSLWRDPVSALAAGPQGWVQDLTFVVAGVLLIAFGLGLHLALRPSRHVDPGPGFVALFGVGLVGAGVFPAVDAAGVFVDDRLPHIVAGFVTFASAGIAALALAPRLRRDPQWSDIAGVMRVGGVILVVLFLAGGVLVRPAGAPLHDWLGLFQWVFLAVWFPCVVVLARRLMARSALLRAEPVRDGAR